MSRRVSAIYQEYLLYNLEMNEIQELCRAGHDPCTIRFRDDPEAIEYCEWACSLKIEGKKQARYALVKNGKEIWRFQG